MSDIQKSLRTYLLSKTAVRNRVGERIHFDFLPPPAKTPAIVIEEFATDHYHQLSGAAGIYEATVRITVYSADRSESNAVGEVVRANVQGYRGTAGTDTVESVRLDSRVKDALPGNQFDVRGRASGSNRSTSRLYTTELTFLMFVNETIPSY